MKVAVSEKEQAGPIQHVVQWGMRCSAKLTANPFSGAAASSSILQFQSYFECILCIGQGLPREQSCSSVPNFHLWRSFCSLFDIGSRCPYMTRALAIDCLMLRQRPLIHLGPDTCWRRFKIRALMEEAVRLMPGSVDDEGPRRSSPPYRRPMQ